MKILRVIVALIFAHCVFGINGCALFYDRHEGFKDEQDYVVRVGESFSLLKKRKTLFSAANRNQRDVEILSENASTIEYEIRWNRTCKYVLTVDKAADRILAWRYAVTDTKDCLANP
jgi:hypothetical protein